MHDSARRPAHLLFFIALAIAAALMAQPALGQTACESTGPVCDGECPTGSDCVPDGTGGECTCAAIACDEADFPECAAGCPPGQRCNTAPTGAQGCRCGFPGGGTDLSPTSGVFTVELDASMGGQLVQARVDGELLLQWQDPQVDPASGERSIQTEILSMDLAGVDPSLGRVSVRAGRQLNLPPSLGRVVAKQPDSDFPALAAFDVFFEVEVELDGATRLLRNDEPLVMVAQIDQVPPRNIGLRNQGPVLLIDNDNPNNPHVLRRAFHWMCPPPFPPPGVPCTIPCDLSPFPECFADDCPDPLECMPDEVNGGCRCDTDRCGDGNLDPGEECDDGNNVDGDGCSADCRIELDCFDSEFPVCDGFCPPPSVCTAFTNGECRCELPACEQGPYPECGGACPGDGLCTPNSLTGECECAPPPKCSETYFPECDGLCDDPNEECRQAGDTDFCRCQPKQEPRCEDLGGDPVCDGFCPPADDGTAQRCFRPSSPTAPCECRPCDSVPPGSDTTIRFTSATHLIWDRLRCAETYNVYKSRPQVRPTDQDGDGVADDYGDCAVPNTRQPEHHDPVIPPSGLLNTYLITGLNGIGEGLLGHTSTGALRPNLNPCPQACQNAGDFPTCGGACPTGETCKTDPSGVQRCFCDQDGFPPGGTDLSTTVGHVTVTLSTGETVDLFVDGETLLRFDDPQTDPATGERTVQTEILSMDLVGSHPSIGDVNVRAGRQFGLPPTLGSVTPLGTASDFPALATFDVFFEVEVRGVALLRNDEPLKMEAPIDAIPPRNLGLANLDPVDLTDVLDPSHVDTIRRAFHWMCPPPFPPPGEPCRVPCERSRPDQCLGDCPPGQFCNFVPGAADCFCDDLPIACDQSDPGVCDGDCPPGQVCVIDAAGGACFCDTPPATCSQSPFPECGGDCPAGYACQTGAGQICRCTPEPNACEDSPFPECGGDCPPGTHCEPAGSAVILPSPELPPESNPDDCANLASGYAALRPVAYADGSQLSDSAASCFRNVTTTLAGEDELATFDATVDGIWENGGTAVPLRLTGRMTTRAHGKGGQTTGTWDTEIISMSLSGNVGGIPVHVRESSGLASQGQTSVEDVGGGQFRMDSFFDVWTEVSVDGGPFVAQEAPARLDLRANDPGPADTCECVPDPLPCEAGPYPECGGACPPEFVCKEQTDVGVDECRCEREFPPAGTDLSPTVGHVTVELSTGEVVDLIVDGETLLQFSDPQTDPATGERTVQTEILSMDLSGNHPSIGDVNVKAGRQFGLSPTLGSVTPLTTGGDFPALATFDVFFEVEVSGATDATLRNSQPLVMQATIDQIPPRALGLANEQPVQLVDTQDPDHVDTIRRSFHWMCPPPFPPPGVPCPVPCENSRPDQCLGDCPEANQVCTPDPTGGPCFCDTPPPLCEDGPYPECGGECPPGFSCHPEAANEFCRCVPDAQPCEQGPFPECGGTCPDEHACKAGTDAAGNEACFCERTFPPAGTDLSPTVGHVTVDLSTGETAELVVQGETLLQFGDPQTDPATGERTVQTEILSMNLVGSHPSIGDVNVKAGQQNGLPKTKGKVVPKQNDSDFPALASFDVFFEVDVQGAQNATLRNSQPLVMQAQIDQIPPRALGLQNQQPVQLVDTQDPNHVDTIRRSFHWMCPPPFPPPGQPCPVPCENSRPDQCLGDCPDPDQLCTPDPAGGPCFCDTPPPLCEDSEPDVCDGECPPGDVCTTIQGECRCIKPFCSDAEAPECDGVCPSPRVCEYVAAADVCRCSALPACEDSPAPECGGTCPAGQTCRTDAAGGVCFCEPDTVQCEQGPAPTCDGDCPQGLVCQTDAAGGSCFCAQPIPCEQSQFPTCGGECSAGLTCLEVPGAQACRCQ